MRGEVIVGSRGKRGVLLTEVGWYSEAVTDWRHGTPRLIQCALSTRWVSSHRAARKHVSMLYGHTGDGDTIGEASCPDERRGVPGRRRLPSARQWLLPQLSEGVSNSLLTDIALGSPAFFSSHSAALKPFLAKYRVGNGAKQVISFHSKWVGGKTLNKKSFLTILMKIFGAQSHFYF